MTNYQFAIINSTIFIAASQIAPNPITALLLATAWVGLAIFSGKD